MKAINTNHAPAAIGPYVQANQVGNFLFTSGQIPVDPKTGLIADDVKMQTKQVLENIKAILTEADYSVSHVVKMTVFIKNMDQFSDINRVYEQFFLDNHANFPARSCVEVARLPKDVLVEIEAVAYK